ncbi:hypothetical protein M407DRAFT_33940 [Tulasnella calospora MUT 4182]|uniref:Uncharacterized protein n=1 Tax=Tulasnella calospora MUT 4182 TaxID=1051891 RepID=A0A0C3K4W0_9AGAM|nr:hypothetical protein M407DRAFT_33940 [Tulasnella calospora MUT 4182]
MPLDEALFFSPSADASDSTTDSSRLTSTHLNNAATYAPPVRHKDLVVFSSFQTAHTPLGLSLRPSNTFSVGQSRLAASVPVVLKHAAYSSRLSFGAISCNNF